MAMKGTDKQAQASLDIVDRICGQIGNVTDEAKASGIFQRWLKFQQSFWRYSANNTMLLAFQAHQYGISLSNVGGATKWKSLGRTVKSEAWNQRLWILAPVFKKVEDKNGKEKSILSGFRSVYVFDKSQTEGEETPTLDYRAPGDDAGLVASLESVYRDHGIELTYVDDTLMTALYGEGCNGVCMGKTVRVRNTLAGAERAGTLAHELAHAMLHFKDDGKLDTNHSRSVAEIEAESVAACVLGAWGLEWQRSAFYIACWEGDKEKVKASMSRIANTAKNILSTILPEEKGE
jgi:hypothetical protein